MEAPTYLLISILVITVSNCDADCDKYPQFRLSPTSPSCDPLEYCRINVRHNAEFVPERRKCILPVGGACNISDINTACPMNSFCSENNKCVCEDMFVPNIMRTCVRGMSYDALCSAELDRPPTMCPINEGFKCVSGRCVCGKDRFYNRDTDSCVKTKCEDRGDSEVYFDWQTQECTLEIGEERGYYFLRYLTDNLIKCPPNAHIKEGYSKIRVGPHVGVCMCDKGYHSTEDRRSCKRDKSNGEACEAEDDCDSWAGLTCNRGKCECQYAIWSQKDGLCYSAENCRRRDPESYFDAAAITCYKRIGRPCDPYGDVKCPQNSSCRNSTMTCACDEGFNPLGKGEGCTKAKLYGEICGMPGKGGYFNLCSKNNKLSCIGGDGGPKSFPKCGCGPNEIWNAKTKVCDLREGQECVVNPMPDDFQCARHAKCVTEISTGVCKCDMGYIVTQNKLCVGSNEEPTYTKCMITSDCKTFS